MTALPLLGVYGPNEPGLHEPDTRSLTGLLVGHLVLRQAPAVNGLWMSLPGDAGGVIQEVGESIVEPLSREADLEAIRGWLALEAGDVPAAQQRLDEALERAPAGEARSLPASPRCCAGAAERGEIGASGGRQPPDSASYRRLREESGG